MVLLLHLYWMMRHLHQCLEMLLHQRQVLLESLRLLQCLVPLLHQFQEVLHLHQCLAPLLLQFQEMLLHQRQVLLEALHLRQCLAPLLHQRQVLVEALHLQWLSMPRWKAPLLWFPTPPRSQVWARGLQSRLPPLPQGLRVGRAFPRLRLRGCRGPHPLPARLVLACRRLLVVSFKALFLQRVPLLSAPWPRVGLADMRACGLSRKVLQRPARGLGSCMVKMLTPRL